MPKFKTIKKGHLIKGEVEFTVIKDCAYFSVSNQIHSNELKISTFKTIEEASDCARECWVKNPNPMETYKVYRHTKGKTTYSHGHFQQISWVDYDYTNPNRSKSKPTLF